MSSVDYVSTSLLRKGKTSRNCPEFLSHRGDRTIKNGDGKPTWPNSVKSPVRVIQVEKSSFRAFHYDLDDPNDSLLCLTRGRKLWMTVRPSNIGAELERHCGDDSERCFSDTVRFLRTMPPRQKKHIFYCFLDESKTLYLPYAWAHSVLTIVEDGSVDSMWYMEFFTDEEEVAKRRGNAANKYRTGMGRQEALGTTERLAKL